MRQRALDDAFGLFFGEWERCAIELQGELQVCVLDPAGTPRGIALYSTTCSSAAADGPTASSKPSRLR